MKYLAQIRIFREIVLQQLAQVFYCKWNALDKMWLFLEIATESVGTQSLKSSEKDKMTELALEISFVYRLVFTQGVDVMRYQFHPERIRKIGFGLPQERSHIVIERAFSSALEIDEIRFSVFYHYVAALEVAVQEGGRGTAHQDFGHVLEFIFQFVFLEFQSRSFQKAVFEVVQVP